MRLPEMRKVLQQQQQQGLKMNGLPPPQPRLPLKQEAHSTAVAAAAAATALMAGVARTSRLLHRY